MFKKIIALTMGSLIASSSAIAAIKTESVEYTFDGKTMEGYLAYDDSKKTPGPGIILVPDYWGLSQYDKDKAEQLAKQGYVAFAVDMYGKGIRPQDAKEAGQFSSQYTKNFDLWRSDIMAAYDTFKAMKMVNPKKILVMGYCFGGATALLLARTGVPLVGTALFHPSLICETCRLKGPASDLKKIKGPVLAMIGEDDPVAPLAERTAFRDEMKKAHVPLTLITYKGVVHAFTHPNHPGQDTKVVDYNEAADKDSWMSFEQFLKKVFKK